MSDRPSPERAFAGWERWRRPAAWVVFALAVIVSIASVLTIWAKRQVLDTGQWTRTSTELLESGQVRQAVATALVDELYMGVDVPGALERALPDRLDPLAGPAAAALREVAVDQAEALLASSAVQNLWARANQRTHEAFLALLDGERSGPVALVDGAVVLDLRPLVDRLRQRLGLEGDRLRQRLGLQGDRLGDVGVITIIGPDQVEPAIRAVNALKKLTSLLFIAALGLYALAVWLAAGARRTMLAACGAALLGVGVMVLVARRVAGTGVVDALVEAPSSKAAAWDVWLVSTGLLRDLAVALCLYGAVALLAVFLSGASRPARAVRRFLAPAFRRAPAAVFAGVAVLLLLALLWAPVQSGRRLYGTLLIAALVLVGVEALRRQTVREFPGAPPPA